MSKGTAYDVVTIVAIRDDEEMFFFDWIPMYVESIRHPEIMGLTLALFIDKKHGNVLLD